MRSLIIICCALLAMTSCNNEANSTNSSDANSDIAYQKINGNTQGTTYNITYQDGQNRDFTASVDSLLAVYDLQLSTYIDNSVITKLNNSTEHIFPLGANSVYFQECYNISKEVYFRTNGSFNPALYPIIAYWGFFKGEINKNFSQTEIDSILLITNFGEEYFSLKDNTLSRKFTDAKLDFNAVAQGHAVDVVGRFLASKGIKNFMVEIGGEVTCKGTNPEQENWSIGVDKPIENSVPGENLEFIASLENISMATSGNYRKFYELDGKKYSHTINPVTGSPVEHNLLSVSVISKTCADADAYATSFMVMGLLNSMNFINNNPDLELSAYFVFDANGELNTAMTKGFEKYIKQ